MLSLPGVANLVAHELAARVLRGNSPDSLRPLLRGLQKTNGVYLFNLSLHTRASFECDDLPRQALDKHMEGRKRWSLSAPTAGRATTQRQG